MPHSKFKEKSDSNDSGVLRCPCGQTFRDLSMKFQMHCKFCNESIDDCISVPKEAMTSREHQLDDVERRRRFQENHQQYLSQLDRYFKAVDVIGTAEISSSSIFNRRAPPTQDVPSYLKNS